MKYFLSVLLVVVVGSGYFLIPKDASYDAGSNDIKVGAISYPSSLDSLTNPLPGDSVAVVSHSAQHANENDAIEALEAKLGVTSSTALVNSVLTGNGSGSSIWSTFATTSSIYSTNITAIGSTTLQNFSFLNATGTQATTTNLTVSSVTSSVLSTNATGGIGAVTIGSGLLYSGNTLSVTTGSSVFYVSTSTSSNYRVAGPISVTSGSKFMIQGKISVGNTESSVLRVKQSTYTASTTLDSVTPGNFVGIGVTQAYWISTTTQTVYFDLTSTGSYDASAGWSSLIVESF